MPVTQAYLATLFDYNHWANRRICTALAACDEDVLTRDLGSSFRSLYATLLHIYGAEWVWFRRLRGESPPSLPQPEQYPTLAELEAAWQVLAADYRDFVAALAEPSLVQLRRYQDTRGNAYEQPVWQILVHVVNHSSYHRGQITTMLRQVGATPVATDLIVYFRESNAQT